MAKTYASLCIAAALTLTASCMSASTICPTTANTNTDCGYILTIGPGGVISGAPVPNAAPYDGSDDSLIGLVNDSGANFNGPINLMGSGNGGGIFAFDNDGICTFVFLPYCTTAATGYEGPDTTFSNISTTSVFDDTGTVNVANLAAGATSYFSLESSPNSISIAISPEPGTMALLGGGLLLVALAARARRKRLA